MRPLLEAILRGGVTSKEDLRRKVGAAIHVTPSKTELDLWLRMTGLIDLFEAPRVIKLDDHSPSSGQAPLDNVSSTLLNRTEQRYKEEEPPGHLSTPVREPARLPAIRTDPDMDLSEIADSAPQPKRSPPPPPPAPPGGPPRTVIGGEAGNPFSVLLARSHGADRVPSQSQRI